MFVIALQSDTFLIYDLWLSHCFVTSSLKVLIIWFIRQNKMHKIILFQHLCLIFFMNNSALCMTNCLGKSLNTRQKFLLHPLSQFSPTWMQFVSHIYSNYPIWYISLVTIPVIGVSLTEENCQETNCPGITFFFLPGVLVSFQYFINSNNLKS